MMNMRINQQLLFSIILLWHFSILATAQGTETKQLRILEIPGPTLSGGESNLFVDERGIAWISWVEYLNDSTDALMYGVLEDESWSAKEEIARGSDWFVNWADFPSLAVFPNSNGQKILCHWLQKSTAGKFDYDIVLGLKQNPKEGWGNPFLLNRDGIAAEHGFVTLIPENSERILATWLDGRNTKIHSQHNDSAPEGHHGGPMSLRSAVVDAQGRIIEEAQLDDMVCDCCQTDIAIGQHGPIIVYRNRSEKEVRDIFIVRRIQGKWSDPKPVFRDKWKIPGCPVNGPAIATRGKKAAVAWFTGANGNPEVRVSFSKNDGKHFSKAIRVHEDTPLGRVDIEWVDEDHVMLTWMEQKGEKAQIRIRKISIEGKCSPPMDIMITENSRASGFPVLAIDKYGLLLSATDAAGQNSRVRTFRLLPIQQ